MLPRDFVQACWLFQLLDKNLPQEETVRTDNPEGTSPTNEPETQNQTEQLEQLEQPEANDINGDEAISNLEPECNDIDAMSAENNVEVGDVGEGEMDDAQVDCNIEVDASVDLEVLPDEIELVEPKVMPLDPDELQKLVSLLVDRTSTMTLSQVEDVGIALSALAVSCHGQDVSQVLNVVYLNLTLDFI